VAFVPQLYVGSHSIHMPTASKPRANILKSVLVSESITAKAADTSTEIMMRGIKNEVNRLLLLRKITAAMPVNMPQTDNNKV
jgi:hypothetical protein